jgi:hypothetical protein
MADDYDPTAEEARELARKLGRLGGLKGGKARAEKLTPEERKEIARKAPKARWAKNASKTSLHNGPVRWLGRKERR